MYRQRGYDMLRCNKFARMIMINHTGYIRELELIARMFNIEQIRLFVLENNISDLHSYICYIITLICHNREFFLRLDEIVIPHVFVRRDNHSKIFQEIYNDSSITLNISFVDEPDDFHYLFCVFYFEFGSENPSIKFIQSLQIIVDDLPALNSFLYSTRSHGENQFTPFYILPKKSWFTTNKINSISLKVNIIGENRPVKWLVSVPIDGIRDASLYVNHSVERSCKIYGIEMLPFYEFGMSPDFCCPKCNERSHISSSILCQKDFDPFQHDNTTNYGDMSSHEDYLDIGDVNDRDLFAQEKHFEHINTQLGQKFEYGNIQHEQLVEHRNIKQEQQLDYMEIQQERQMGHRNTPYEQHLQPWNIQHRQQFDYRNIQNEQQVKRKNFHYEPQFDYRDIRQEQYLYHGSTEYGQQLEQINIDYGQQMVYGKIQHGQLTEYRNINYDRPLGYNNTQYGQKIEHRNVKYDQQSEYSSIQNEQRNARSERQLEHDAKQEEEIAPLEYETYYTNHGKIVKDSSYLFAVKYPLYDDSSITKLNEEFSNDDYKDFEILNNCLLSKENYLKWERHFNR